MKVLTHKKPLLEGLDLVKDAVSKLAALPILKDVKITAEGENLYLYTTNLTTGIKTRIKEANIVESGIACCDVMKLLSIVKELPDSEIILTKEENGQVRVECENVSFKLVGLSEEEFPAEMTPSEQNGSPIGQEFFSAIAKVRHAVSKEESRYNLNGIYFDKDIVATDGHRLSLTRGTNPLRNTLVPSEFVNTILRLRRNGNQTYRLSRSDSTIFIFSEDLIIHSRLIDGEFPDYGQVIPSTHERTATMDRHKLYHAIKRITLMSDKSNQIRFEFCGGYVLLASANPDAGEAREELEADYTPTSNKELPYAIGFAGKYVLDVLEVLENDQVTFLMNDPDQPLRIEEKDSTHIIMPVRLIESFQQEEKKAA
jgi:DNA polymerase III subunit beta